MTIPYLPAEGPIPSIDDAPFWEFCRRHELRFQCCRACGRFRHPPGPVCAACRGTEADWRPASDDANVFSFTVVHHPVSSAMRAFVPYNIAIVAFPGCQDLKLISNVIDAQPGELRLGLPLSLAWEEAANGIPLPRFRKRT